MTSSADFDTAAAPEWYITAMSAPVTEHETIVAGTPIAYREWGEPTGRGIVLVHGSMAHSHWWDHIGPLLTGGRRVIALDLSGHGDSGTRTSYSLDSWASEVLAVAEDAGLDGPPVVIGHSMGGTVALWLAALFGSRVEGVITIDSVSLMDVPPQQRSTRQLQVARTRRGLRGPAVYPSREEAIAQFRPFPYQPVLGYIADHVAATSVREVAGGWTWKWDSGVLRREHTVVPTPRLDCRLAVLRAERGVLSAELGEAMHDRLGRAVPVIEIPAARHHVMLDQPIALVTALRTLLSSWDHSLPELPH
jgi:pimeloyl-ACP methyl ester carboxylesterase